MPVSGTMAAMFILFHKPAEVLCQFTDTDGRKTLADYIEHPGVYSAGRLDLMSEGLLVLTDNGRLKNRISGAGTSVEKTYWVQIEGHANAAALQELVKGVLSKGDRLTALQARVIAEPSLAPRIPPIRERRSIPTQWLEMTLKQGRNRQIRRMTAAVGLPTLRLVRSAIGPWKLGKLAAGEQLAFSDRQAQTKLAQWRPASLATRRRSP